MQPGSQQQTLGEGSADHPNNRQGQGEDDRREGDIPERDRHAARW
jgi:hypothetical protein